MEPAKVDTATLLLDGRVLVAGGAIPNDSALAAAELYDVASGTWTATREMTEARFGHTATLLRDGTVLVAGGGTRGSIGSGETPSASAERFDPASGTWTATGSMGVIRPSGQTATLLRDGKVLLAGGYGSIPDAVTNSAELYDPDSGTWTPTGTMIGAHANFTATLLPNGLVLVAGGGGGGRFAYLRRALPTVRRVLDRCCRDDRGPQHPYCDAPARWPRAGSWRLLQQ